MMAIIWSCIRLFIFQRVDSKKLEKAEQLLQRKQEKRDGAGSTGSTTSVYYKGSGSEGSATATQAISRREENACDGASLTKDIRIENFDISFGDKVGHAWENAYCSHDDLKIISNSSLSKRDSVGHWTFGKLAQILLWQLELESYRSHQFFCKMLFDKNKNKQKEAVLGPFKKYE